MTDTGVSSLTRDAWQGVPSIHRAIINIKEEDDLRGKKGDKELLVEGYGLQKVMITEGTAHAPVRNPSVSQHSQESLGKTLPPTT